MESQSQSAKLPLFSGDLSNFQLWWLRFQAFATATGFKPAINKVIDPKMPADNAKVLDMKTADGKAAALAKKQNELAMAYLIMLFQSDRMIGMVNTSKDSAWPNGLACRVIDALFKKVCSTRQSLHGGDAPSSK